MPTDAERREVARRLRELHLGGGSKDLIELTLTDAVGARRKSGMIWDFITERLADLIDPGQGHFVDPAEKVDRDALLALTDEMERARRAYLDWPVLLIAAPVLLRELSRRIREACGEVVSDGGRDT